MEKIELDFGAFGTVYYDADGQGARLDAVRAGGGVPARARAAGRAAVRRRDPDHLRLPRRRVEPLGAAVALPGRDRRGPRPWRPRARGLLVPVCRGRLGVRALPGAQDRLPAVVSRPTSGSSSCALRAASASRASISAGYSPSPKGSARRCCASSRRRSESPRQCRRRGPSQSGLAPAYNLAHAEVHDRSELRRRRVRHARSRPALA